jgi:spore coat protein H
METGMRNDAKQFPEINQPPGLWPTTNTQTVLRGTELKTAGDLFRATNIWLARLKFAGDQWANLEPKRVPKVGKLFEDGRINLVNPRARRNGLAGALGFDFAWSQARLDFAGLVFPEVGIRYRGNGTYFDSKLRQKRPFKIDMNQFVQGQKLVGLDKLSLNNLVEDSSFMRDALGYELFRDAHVPSPRTAFAWLAIEVDKTWSERPFGLYLLLENIDRQFALEHFGTRKAPIFKPVTYDLFKDLGDRWEAYDRIYDLKTEATAEQKQRVIDLARLVTHADDTAFAQRVGEFVDMDNFARFLSGLVLLSSYDGFLSDGQNFYIFLDPTSKKFGFIPWDLDHAWGEFSAIGTTVAREQASIWQPSAVRNRFLERMLAVNEFRNIYRQCLTEMLNTLFVPDRLFRKIDTLAEALRDPIAAEGSFWLKRFEQAISTNWVETPIESPGWGIGRPVFQLKRFIAKREQSVRDQIEGRSEGVVLKPGWSSK